MSANDLNIAEDYNILSLDHNNFIKIINSLLLARCALSLTVSSLAYVSLSN
jgi:hypothetical protein